MRWSWPSFASGVLGGAALAALLWLTFGVEPENDAPPPTKADAPEAEPAVEEAAPDTATEPPAAPRAERVRVDPTARTPREDAPPPVNAESTITARGGIVVSSGEGGVFRVSFKGGDSSFVRILDGGFGDPAPALLKWSKARAREIFPEAGPVARAEVASRLADDGYAERAAGLGLALRARPVPLDLLLAAARDRGYPDLRGAALLAAIEAAPEDDDVRAAVLELVLDTDPGARRTATPLLRRLGEQGAARAAAILLSGDYTGELLEELSAAVAAGGGAADFLGASPPPDAALSVVQQLAGRLKEPKDDDDRRLAQTLPQLVRPLLEAPEADQHASLVLPQLAALGHGAFLRGVATTPLYRPRVRSAAVSAALANEATRPDGISAAGAILTDPTADVALARGVLGALDDAWLDDPSLRGALAAAARGHPSAWVRDSARARLTEHDPSAAGTIVIHEAKYGAGDAWVDVTDALRGAIREGRLAVRATNDLAGDPKVGAHKTLRVEYSVGGERRLKTVGEGGQLIIP